MKQLFTLIFSLFSLFICAQQKDMHKIKIYLEDAETGKSINDAKVTLEGFEIPAITGQYDRKGKYYYFDQVPAGYNTIMSYHKKYNEKGFQNLEGLPRKLKLKLQSSYRIKIPGDSINFYKEDDHRICILFNDTILNTLKTCPDFNSQLLCFVKDYISTFYKNLVIKDELRFGISGLNTVSVEKKDKTKFKRFNDPIIEKLIKDKNILELYAILLITKTAEKTYFEKDGTSKYIPKYIKYIHCDDKKNNYTSNLDLATKSNTSSEAILDPSRNYPSSNAYHDFKTKQKKGRIKENTYERNKKEITFLADSDITRIRNGELLDNFNDDDTIVISCQKLRPVTSMPTSQNYLKQYKAASNILSYNAINLISRNSNFYYKINYAINDIVKYKKENSLIELRKTNEDSYVYRLKNNIASPLGTIDLIEYYNSSGIKIYQKIEKNINR